VCVSGPSWKKRRKWTPEEFFATGVVQVNAVMAKIERLGLRVQHDRALDFGCGVGRLTQPLSNYFAEVSGVDISKHMLERARKYDVTGRCKFQLNEQDDLILFPNDSFDFILSLITLQHIEPR
jgi:ubiquinone/menaquinone biosynthesis C-methylase UbiE